MFFSIFHALIPNFYVLFSIVYSLFFVLGELSWFSTPFSVFYNKGGGFTGFFFSCFFATCRVFHPFRCFLQQRGGFTGFCFSCLFATCRVLHPFRCFLQQRGWVYRLLLFLLLRNLPGFPPLSLFSTTKGVGLPAFSFLASSQPAGFSTPFNISSLK